MPGPAEIHVDPTIPEDRSRFSFDINLTWRDKTGTVGITVEFPVGNPALGLQALAQAGSPEFLLRMADDMAAGLDAYDRAMTQTGGVPDGNG